MKLQYIVTSVALPGADGFAISFNYRPSVSGLGIIIGYAKIAQRKAGRTCFAISAARENLLFQPATPVEDDMMIQKQLEDLVFLLNGIGFQIADAAFASYTENIRPAVAQTEQPLAA